MAEAMTDQGDETQGSSGVARATATPLGRRGGRAGSRPSTIAVDDALQVLAGAQLADRDAAWR